MADFLVGETVGTGSDGRVVHAILRGGVGTGSGGPRTLPPHRAGGHVAIKAMDRASLLRRPGGSGAALRERRILSAMAEEGGEGEGEAGVVVRLLLSFVDIHCLYLVTEVCDGGTLTDLLRHARGGRSGAGEAWDGQLLHVLAQVLRGLEQLHRRGYVHRDVKPANVLLRADGSVCLADLGSALDLAEAPGGAPDGGKGGDGGDDLAGTADYVSPEVLRGGGGTVGPEADLWSYGCLVHCCAKGGDGKSPFHAESDHLAMRAVLDHAAAGGGKGGVGTAEGDVAQDLVGRILVGDPAGRLGSGEVVPATERGGGGGGRRRYGSIRSHPYLGGVDWEGLDTGSSVPPRQPPTPGWVERYQRGEYELRDGRMLEGDLEWFASG